MYKKGWDKKTELLFILQRCDKPTRVRDILKMCEMDDVTARKHIKSLVSYGFATEKKVLMEESVTKYREPMIYVYEGKNYDDWHDFMARTTGVDPRVDQVKFDRPTNPIPLFTAPWWGFQTNGYLSNARV